MGNEAVSVVQVQLIRERPVPYKVSHEQVKDGIVSGGNRAPHTRRTLAGNAPCGEMPDIFQQFIG
jgi:hypothetical protein